MPSLLYIRVISTHRFLLLWEAVVSHHPLLLHPFACHCWLLATSLETELAAEVTTDNQLVAPAEVSSTGTLNPVTSELNVPSAEALVTPPQSEMAPDPIVESQDGAPVVDAGPELSPEPEPVDDAEDDSQTEIQKIANQVVLDSVEKGTGDTSVACRAYLSGLTCIQLVGVCVQLF